jgi:hypothetical protein
MGGNIADPGFRAVGLDLRQPGQVRFGRSDPDAVPEAEGLDRWPAAQRQLPAQSGQRLTDDGLGISGGGRLDGEPYP